MGSISKSFSLLLIVLLAVSSLIMAKPAFAQTPTTTPTTTFPPIPTPSVPEFTVQLVGPSVNVPTTYSLNQSSGQIVAKIGYTNEYSAVNITIKNQPFTHQVIDSSGDTTYFYYSVRIKPHNEDDWVDVYNLYNGYTIQSNSIYTTISISIEGQSDSPLTAIAGNQSDIQVEALIGYITGSGDPFIYSPYVFHGSESGWSNTQTLSIPANIPLSPTPAPSSSTSTVTPTPTLTSVSSAPNASLLLITTIALVVIAFLLAIIIFLLLYIRKRRTAFPQTTPTS